MSSPTDLCSPADFADPVRANCNSPLQHKSTVQVRVLTNPSLLSTNKNSSLISLWFPASEALFRLAVKDVYSHWKHCFSIANSARQPWPMYTARRPAATTWAAYAAGIPDRRCSCGAGCSSGDFVTGCINSFLRAKYAVDINFYLSLHHLKS